MIPGSARAEPIQLNVEMRRVLVVDEALPIRRKLEEILGRAGLGSGQVRCATGAEEALEIFALEHPDLVFAELVGSDPAHGLDMVLEMLTVDPHAKIVLVTAEPADSILVRQAVRKGVFAVIPKPVRNDKIRQVLADIENEDGAIERFRLGGLRRGGPPVRPEADPPEVA